MALPPHLADLEGRLASRVDEALAGFRRAFEARLREATERLLAEATDVASPNVAGILAEVESEALDAAPRREGARAAVATLLDAARTFDRATTQAEVLSALLAAGRSAADRLALLLVRDDLLVEFESVAIDGEFARGRELPFAGGLRESLDARRGCLALGAEASADACRELGWSPNGAAAVVPLVLRDRIAALLWADRAGSPPDLAPLQLLTQMAAQRLELQALSVRETTPTLYETSDAPGEPLALWSAQAAPAIAAVAVAEPLESELEEPPLDAAESFEIVGDESADAAALFEPAVEAPVEPTVEAVSEPEAERVVELAAAPSPAGEWAPEFESVDAAAEMAGPAIEAPIERVADELWTGAVSGSVTAPFDLSEFAPASEEPAAAAPPLPEAQAPIATPEAPASAGATWDLSSFEAVAPEPAPPTPEPVDFEPIESEAATAIEFEPEAPAELVAESASGSVAELDSESVSQSVTEVEAAFELEAPRPTEPESSPLPPLAAGEIDLLSTMRLPVLNFPLAGAERRPEEATAPLEITELPAPGQAATTHEFPAPELAPPVAPPPAVAEPAEPDLTEDATVLTRRIPVMPAPAPPAAVVEPALPSFGAPAVTPFGSPVTPFGSAVAPAPAPPVAPLPPPAPAPPAEDPMDRTASRHRSTEVAPPPDLQGPGRAFLGGRVQRAAAESPTHEEAKRLARLLISEIKLYNEEQVLEGRRNRDLYHRLKEDIDRSRQIYEERVDPAVRTGSDYFHQELVRSLAGGDPRALGI